MATVHFTERQEIFHTVGVDIDEAEWERIFGAPFDPATATMEDVIGYASSVGAVLNRFDERSADPFWYWLRTAPAPAVNTDELAAAQFRLGRANSDLLDAGRILTYAHDIGREAEQVHSDALESQREEEALIAELTAIAGGTR